MTQTVFRVSRTELARLIAATPDRISRFIAEGMPVLETGSGRGRRTVLDLAVALPWILQRRTGSLDEARTRLATAQAEKTERENTVRRGQLVEASEVEREFADCAAAVKARLRRIPDSVADRLLSAKNPHAIKTLLLSEIDAALLELSRRADPDGGER